MKPRQLYTFFLPDLVTDGVLEDSTVVVIDILRATTTMTTALANGATCIVPCVGVDQAHLTKQRLLDELVGKHDSQGKPASGSDSGSDLVEQHTGDPHESWRKPPVLLGGERLGKPLPGFDLGNSPDTYHPAAIAGRTVVMTTTNGTRAMDRCRGAKQIVIGSFANLSRVVQHLQTAERVVLVCSGTDRNVTSEDVLFAGAVCDELVSGGKVPLSNEGDRAGFSAWQCSDASELARCYWQRLRTVAGTFPTADAILDVFLNSLGGSNLVAQGRAVDLEFAAQIDRFDNLPILDQTSWRITNGS